MSLIGKSQSSFATRLGVVVAALSAWFIVPCASAQQYSSSAEYHQQIETLVQDQYPNQGGYSRQGYHPNQENNTSIWSHLAVEGGAGFVKALGNTKKWQTVGYNITLGAGWMFSDQLGVLAEYSFNGASIPTSTLNAVSEPDGNVHVWSMTLEPIYYFNTSGHLGGYITGGGGFYRKLTSFTQPVYAGNYCSYFYGCYPQYQNVTLSHFSSNQGGVNFGVGGTYKLNPDGKAKLYAEARYVWVDSPRSTKGTVGTGTVSMIPVTFGFRW